KDTPTYDLVWLWFRSPHDELAARMMRTSEPPHWSMIPKKPAPDLIRGVLQQLAEAGKSHPALANGKDDIARDAERPKASRVATLRSEIAEFSFLRSSQGT